MATSVKNVIKDLKNYTLSRAEALLVADFGVVASKGIASGGKNRVDVVDTDKSSFMISFSRSLPISPMMTVSQYPGAEVR